MHQFKVLLTASLVLLLASASIAQSGDTVESDAPETTKALAGKGGFSLDRFEESLFDEKAKAIQARISEMRKQKIERFEKLVDKARPGKKMADYIFRLAEAHWDEAKYRYLLKREA